MKRVLSLIVVLAFGLALPLDSEARGGGRSHASKGKTSKVAKSSARGSVKSPRVAKGSGGSGGCGSRGGPGYRKANGKCAGWKG